MKYHLVLQLPATDESDIDNLYEIEEQLERIVRSPAYVDGHDCGSGEMNFFIHTNNPKNTFAAVKKYFDKTGYAQVFKAAYRESTGETYTILWPESLESFSII